MTTAKKPSTPAPKASTSKLTAVKAPADRQAKGPTPAELKRQREAVAEFLSTGIDFTPFTVDAGDGIEWGFKPDMMPGDVEALRLGMKAVDEARADIAGLDAAFQGLVATIRDLLVDEAQQAEFPRPIYGMNAITWFAMTLIGGRSGFPTE